MLRLSNFVSRSICANEKLFHTSSIALAEPMKKRSTLDPQYEANKMKRKVKRIEKEIRRLEKQSKKLKPIDEIEGDRKLKEEMDSRRRPSANLESQELEDRALLFKDWSRFQIKTQRLECRSIKRLFAAQTKALTQLRECSEDLYQAAVQIDESILPITAKGPFLTPPNPQYESPDGEYVDATKTFQYDFDIDRKFLATPKVKKY